MAAETNNQIWWVLAPGIGVAAYFISGLLLYTLRTWFGRGEHRDAEVESRGTTPFIGRFLRLYFAWMMQPWYEAVRRSDLPPSAITTLSFLLACASGIGASVGYFSLAGWLYIFTGVCDYLDGRIARNTGRVTPEGGALDSILDRYADSAVLSGLAWYYRDSWVLAAVLFALAGSSLVPYIRAKGEASGVPIKNGAMQRADRITYLGMSMAFSPMIEAGLHPTQPNTDHRLTIAGIVLLAVSTQYTAVQRFVTLLRALRHDHYAAWRLDLGKRAVVCNVLFAGFATACDFVMMTLLVHVGMGVAWATMIGCMVGGVINFTCNRIWAFASHEPKVAQIARYGLVSVTSALLNSAGVMVFLLWSFLDYRLAWSLARLAVFAAWNYPLHRDYVFAPVALRKPSIL